MLIFAGLGNPGAKYARNRHNIGFMAVDSIAGRNDFGPWRQRFQAQVAEGRLDGQKTLLLKPQTFMNLSGQAVGEAMRFYKLSPTDVWVFHDELDLAPGKVRVKTGGGHAGHNGLRSLHQHLGPEYHRVRLGIGHPGDKSRVTAHVLGDFSGTDRDWLDPLLSAIGGAAGHLALGSADRFMSAVAQATAPAGKAPKAPDAGAEDKTPAPVPENRSPFAILRDKFRRPGG